ncbi:MAG: FolM Alternative dihydrofolate reductase 1 [uncultured Thiotrichaceae bacterium]|uniref:FolM Alternative dihydrofolate reductase 1 n=1 Tax=uncultured Thiotrichaceae bacterium TaxID=298394 RepID=A0A6S6SJI8_9GAMM|nr:MAG: FolM Alternative dihydrofolate reductase 1 [uncultured Thiotrichaceae bacterium]
MMEKLSLEGKVALVTGSARRIGAAIIRRLHAEGAVVVVHYRNSADDALQLQAELNQRRAESCLLVQGDLLDIDKLPQLIAHVIEHAGRLDILVNNASGFYPTSLGEVTERQWDELVGSNMKVPFFMAQAAMSELKKNKGCIINMVDVHGLRPLPDYPVYSSAKAGLFMLTKALAKELGPEIRVNGVAPGAILWPEQGMDESQQVALLGKTALKRSGDPADIAGAVLFLVRDANYITGQIIPVDGGRSLNQ